MTAPAPLGRLKVVELARVLAGPWAGQLLADLGASVVKVESLEGNDTRQWGPPSIENPTGPATPRISIPPIEASARSPSI